MLSILYGLAGAISWGSGDFAGGLASKQAGTYRVVFLQQTIGIIALLPVTVLFGGPMLDMPSLILAALAGIFGTIGLLLLYHSLATGTMSIAAPVSALITALLPVVVSSLQEGLPRIVTITGFAFALAAVWLISSHDQPGTNPVTRLGDLKLPLLAGIGFGLYFTLVHQASQHSLFWPMVVGRFSGLIAVAAFLTIKRIPLAAPRTAWPLITVNGILDIGGNAFFILAGQAGRLDVAAVLSSLYPGATVLLAWLILRERLSRTQWIGIACALTGIVLLAMP